MTTRY